MNNSNNNNFIVSAYFTSKIDPQRSAFTNKDDFNYIKNWYCSIKSLSLNGIILYDDLSESFIQKYSCTNIKFIQVSIQNIKHTVNDARFIVFANFLKTYPCSNVFFTDISDVIINRNPFELDMSKLYVGSERHIKKDFWWSKKFFNKVFNNYPYWNNRLLNCGLIGGNYDNVYRLLSIMQKEILKQPIRKYFVDMMIFNIVVYDNFKEFITGFPLHTVFKDYDTKNSEAYFIHK